jgi:hypothetical protein
MFLIAGLFVILTLVMIALNWTEQQQLGSLNRRNRKKIRGNRGRTR